VAQRARVGGLRTDFPGMGGTIYTNKGVACASPQEFSPSAKSVHRLFLRHAIAKKSEDFFSGRESTCSPISHDRWVPSAGQTRIYRKRISTSGHLVQSGFSGNTSSCPTTRSSTSCQLRILMNSVRDQEWPFQSRCEITR